MIKLSLTLLIGCLLIPNGYASLWASHGLAQSAGREDLRKQITDTREFIFEGKYDEAVRRFGELASKYPDDPAGDFYQAVALTWKSYVDAKLDTGSRAFDQAIESVLASTIKKAESLNSRYEKSAEQEIEALYYLGSAYAMRSRLSLLQNHAIPAARFARTAQEHLNAIARLESNYPDHYFAAGGIYYRVGLLTDSPLGKVVASMLGAKALPVGDRERGLSYLKIAAERGLFTGVDAKLALLEVYTLNENRFAEALPIARELQAKYPGNQTFGRYLLRIYLGLKDRPMVTLTARQILGAVKQRRPSFGRFMKGEAEKFLAEGGRL